MLKHESHAGVGEWNVSVALRWSHGTPKHERTHARARACVESQCVLDTTGSILSRFCSVRDTHEVGSDRDDEQYIPHSQRALQVPWGSRVRSHHDTNTTPYVLMKLVATPSGAMGQSP